MKNPEGGGRGIQDTGVEAALDAREVRFLHDKHGHIPEAEIRRIYQQIKAELMQSAQIRYLIPALALKKANDHLNGRFPVEVRQTQDEPTLVGFEETLDERDIDRLCERHPSFTRERVLEIYNKAKAQLSGDARIRDFLPVLAMNLANEELRGRRNNNLEADSAGTE